MHVGVTRVNKILRVHEYFFASPSLEIERNEGSHLVIPGIMLRE